MSQNNRGRCAKGAEISNAGAFARHAGACDVCERGAGDPEPAENGGYRASDLHLEEIREAVRRADAGTLDATLALHEHTPTDGDTRETAAAKALIQAKSGGKEAYATVFDPCSVDGCEYGRNGFRATTCKRHEGEREAEPETGESEPEAAENDVCENPYSDAKPERESADVGTDALPPRAKLVGELVERGLSPATAENAVSYIRELVDAGLSPREAGEAAAERFA